MTTQNQTGTHQYWLAQTAKVIRLYEADQLDDLPPGPVTPDPEDYRASTQTMAVAGRRSSAPTSTPVAPIRSE